MHYSNPRFKRNNAVFILAVVCWTSSSSSEEHSKVHGPKVYVCFVDFEKTFSLYIGGSTLVLQEPDYALCR